MESWHWHLDADNSALALVNGALNAGVALMPPGQPAYKSPEVLPIFQCHNYPYVWEKKV